MRAEKIAILGVLIALAGVIVGSLAIPIENIQQIRHWVWRVSHQSRQINDPRRDGLGFDRCVFIENTHHCGKTFAKTVADQVCKSLNYTEALPDTLTWSIHQDIKADLVWHGYDDSNPKNVQGTGTFVKLDVGSSLVLGPEEANPGKTILVKTLGIFDHIECE